MVSVASGSGQQRGRSGKETRKYGKIPDHADSFCGCDSSVLGTCAKFRGCAQADHRARTFDKDFVIVRSTAKYEEARRVATEAARRLQIPLNLRDLAPHPSLGLTFPRKDCEDGRFEYPCYIARGRGDDGFYVSIEYSSAYPGFKPGLYVVIVASEDKGGSVVKRAAKAARKIFRDAYTRRTGVYMGCMH